MKIITALAVAALLSGCAKTQEQQAVACLQSDRLSFNDPDSIKVVASLGSRGDSQPDIFWIRYKVKNIAGAYVSLNMACRQGGEGGLRRDKAYESLKVAQIFAGLLGAHNDDLQKTVPHMRVFVNPDQFAVEAERLVFDGVEDFRL